MTKGMKVYTSYCKKKKKGLWLSCAGVCEMASALPGWLSSRAGCVLHETSNRHQEKQGRLQGDIKEINVVCESPRMEGGGELRICKASFTATVFSSLSALFLSLFTRSRITLFWFG